MLLKIRHSFQHLLRRHGIELRKTPPDYVPLPVFDLAVQALMAQRGDALRFVQIGANNGIDGDPLRRYIVKHPWRGVLVEPQPNIFALLKANYATYADRLSFENVAISRGGSLVLYLPPADWPRDKHGVTYVSGVPSVLARQIDVAESTLTRIEVPAMTLDALLAKHGIEQLDLLQIDTEGFDWEVLQAIDLTRFRPAIIHIETGHLSRDALAKVAAHLTHADYLFYYGGWQGDSVAMRRDVFPAD